MRTLMNAVRDLYRSLTTLKKAAAHLNILDFVKEHDQKEVFWTGVLLIGLCTITQAYGKLADQRAGALLQARKWWADHAEHMSEQWVPHCISRELAALLLVLFFLFSFLTILAID